MKANKKIGEIIDNKVIFLNIEFEVEIDSGTINTSVDYDSRILDKNKEKEFQEYIDKFVSGLIKYSVGGEKNDNN